MKVDQQIIEHFKREEGWRNKAYRDHLGYWTIGCGHLITKDLKADHSKLVWTDQQIIDQLQKDINNAVAGAKRIFPNFDSYSFNRRLALVDMVYQMGEAGVRGFVNSVRLVKEEQWAKAADNMLKSKWARQTSARAKRTTDKIRNG